MLHFSVAGGQHWTAAALRAPLSRGATALLASEFFCLLVSSLLSGSQSCRTKSHSSPVHVLVWVDTRWCQRLEGWEVAQLLSHAKCAASPTPSCLPHFAHKCVTLQRLLCLPRHRNPREPCSMELMIQLGTGSFTRIRTEVTRACFGSSGI